MARNALRSARTRAPSAREGLSVINHDFERFLPARRRARSLLALIVSSGPNRKRGHASAQNNADQAGTDPLSRLRERHFVLRIQLSPLRLAGASWSLCS